MARRELSEINAGSMADIAFLLLIFFLVTTTMDTNKGLTRKLPPPVIDEPENPPEVRERNVLVVLLNRNDQLMVENQLTQVQDVCEKTKEFFLNPRDLKDLPEKEQKNIEFFGEIMVSKGVVSLQNDRGTSYEKYIGVQNELVRAVNEIRNEKARSKWGKNYEDLLKDQQTAIRKIYPLAISEAEPKSIK